MATDKAAEVNIDNSDPSNYPNGRIKDNTGAGDGTPVNRKIYGDIHEFFAKLMRLAGIAYNGLPDNEGSGYQLVDAAIALAGKNDFVTALNTIVLVVGGVNTNVMSVPLKLSKLKLNEALICKASFDMTDETLIQGSEPALYTLSVPVAFKNGDYVRFIKTNTGITLVRLADAANLDVLVNELHFLKAATDVQEYAGTLQTVATTPYTAQLAFFRRVCGLDSGMFLASHTRNGLLSAAQWDIINAIPANPIKNVGWLSGVDPGGGTVGSFYPVNGNITTAQITAVGGAGDFTVIRVTMQNAMTNTSYFVRLMLETSGVSGLYDSACYTPVFKPITTTEFDLIIQQNQSVGGVQNLKIHIEAVQI